MRIIGIDPGLRRLGYGVIEMDGARLGHIDSGVVVPSGDTLAARLLSLHVQLAAILVRVAPEAAGIEQTFVNSDGQGTLKLGQARGVALVALAAAGLEPGEYAPNTVKKAVVGRGHADKHQVDRMVRLQLPGAAPAGADAADALAIAICHGLHLAAARGRARVRA